MSSHHPRAWSLLTILLLAWPLSAQQPPKELSAIRERLVTLTREGKAPSIAVAVSRGNDVLWMEALGWADKERKRAATTDTCYAVGSVSKSITGTGVALAVVRGRMKYQEPVNRYLRERLRTYHGEPTVEHLLTMTGGVPHLYQYIWPPERKPTTREVLARNGVSVFPPGATFEYSNLSFTVLEQAVADAVGRDFDSFMRTDVFAPLGMRHTFLEPHPQDDCRPTPYNSKGERPQDFYFLPAGGAGFYSSIADLVKFGRFHLGLHPAGVKVITDNARRAMHGEPLLPPHGYTHGWGVILDGADRMLLSNGAILGGCATLLLIPSEQLVIAAATNGTCSGPVDMDGTVFDIAFTLLPRLAPKFDEVRKKYEAAEKAHPLAPDYFGRWNGTLLFGKGVPISLGLSAGKLTANVAGKAAELREARIVKGLLRGTIATRLDGTDAPLQDHVLDFTLRLDGAHLTGAVHLRSTGTGPAFSLPYYVQLKK